MISWCGVFNIHAHTRARIYAQDVSGRSEYARKQLAADFVETHATDTAILTANGEGVTYVRLDARKYDDESTGVMLFTTNCAL